MGLNVLLLLLVSPLLLLPPPFPLQLVVEEPPTTTKHSQLGHSTNERVFNSAHLRGGDEDADLTGKKTYQQTTNWLIRTITRPHVSMVHIFCDNPSCTDSFTFKFSSLPSPKFSFDYPRPLAIPTNRPFKRRRALSDVDGDGNEGRKKRRLRLHLITSRLSRPFSQPATNIVIRGISKVAVWSKNKGLGRSELRKAAIMNRVKKRMDAAKDYIRLEHEKGRAALSLREIVLQKPRIHELPLPPSPLGLSNYDALDLEDDFDDHGQDEGMDEISAIYSDFNIMNPVTSDGEDYDYLDAIDGISSQDLPDTPPSPPEDSLVEMLKERERTGDSFFVRIRE
ncbi:hypothetical protein BGZ60DRAFT_45640 [Tricladium varicosporioides]|nr:hypothetical protein BGZ60DRAFT_45640 [Hymenoscyphus varicosporioides]